MNRRVAFTLIELLIVMAILGVLVTMLVPVVTGQIEEARRRSCAANLRAIGQKMVEYAHENKGRLPDLFADRNASGGIGFKLGNPTYEYKGNSTNMFILVVQDYLPEDSFICPSTDHTPTALDVVANQDDFVHYTNVSYSMHMQRKSRGTPRGPFPLTLLSSAGMALLADRNPIAGITSWVYWSTGQTYYAAMENESAQGGYDEMQKNSYNHDQNGQNVLYMDGHAEWCENPKVGVNGDNIWTYDDGSLWGSTTGKDGAEVNIRLRYCAPADATDSLLYP